MFVLSVFCMFVLNSFLFSPQIESVLNVENNTNLINGTTKLNNNIEKIIKITEKEATTTKVDEGGEEQTEEIQKVLQTKETTKITTEDPWDKGVTLSSSNKGIPTSTVILAALCLALLVAICNVYCYGKTRGYI